MGGGSGTTTLPGILPVTPAAGDGGYGNGSSPGNPPPPHEVARGTGPPARHEGVYTPTAHEGAPRRGDGPRGREPARAVAGGPTPEWGGGGMAKVTPAAALQLPLAVGMAGTVAKDPPPPPPPPGSSGV